MDALRFTHHFFHFSSGAWHKAADSLAPGCDPAHALFHNNYFPRRRLRGEWPASFSEAMEMHEEELAKERSLGVQALREASPGYPPGILQLVPPERRPPVLYLRGTDVPPEGDLVAIVGTRQPSAHGKDAADSFSAYLGAVGIRIVSGLARGIDTIAHRRGLAGGTVAVLGGGVGRVYPEENQELAERILAEGGCLLSPYPLEQVPLPQNFPERNELIAALAAGTIVIEGAEKSGAAITGRLALAMGKTVIALTQDFRSDFGRGAIRLQQEGAVLAAREEEAIEAIYRRYGGFQGPLPAARSLPSGRSFTFEEFQAATKGSVPEALALLEEGILLGKIERWGRRYRLR